MYSKIICSDEEFRDIKNEWELLEKKDYNIAYYSTYKYVYNNWVNLYKNKNTNLFIICVYENKNLICIAPMIIINKNKFGFSWNKVEFIGIGDYKNFICDNTLRDRIIQASIKEVFKVIEEKSIEKINLTHINSESKLATYLLRNPKYNNSLKYLVECPIFYFKEFKSLDEYLSEFFKPSDIKYYVNKLNKDIGYKFDISYSDKTLDKIKELHIFEKNYLIQNKKRNERASLFENKDRFNSIKSIYENNKNCITFMIKDLKDSILIYYTCYLYNNKLYFWNTAYNPKYEKYDLTKILNYEVFKYIYDNPELKIKAFDYGAGRYPWKFKWTNQFNFVYKLDLWNANDKKMLKALVKIKSKFKNN